MKRIAFLFTLIAFTSNLKAQIGIGNTNPKAQLDISASNQVTPTNTDGIIIPKIDAFPAVNPSIDQQAMLVYLTTATTFGGNAKPAGFYYWNQATTDWVGISSSMNGDHDWYKEGTTTAPTSINDEMFHTGNVAIGKNTADYTLDVASSNVNTTVAVSTTSTTTTPFVTNKGIYNTYSGSSDNDVNVMNNTYSGTSNGVVTTIKNDVYCLNVASFSAMQNAFFGSLGVHTGIQNEMGNASSNIGLRNMMYNKTTNASREGVVNEIYNNTGTGFSYGVRNIMGNDNSGITSNTWGFYNSMIGSGNSPNIGFSNYITNTGNGDHYGVFNQLEGTGTGIKTGLHSKILTTAGGTHYGVYSEVLKAGATNFAGYFLGNVGIGTSTSNIYTFPPSRGTNGQVMRTNGTGIITWNNVSDFAWSTTGNAATAADFIGTTNAQPFKLYSNNVERMRINPTDGEVAIGATTSPYAGDSLAAIGSAALPFSTSGYTSQNGSGIWGETLAASTTNFSSVQGVYGGTGNGSGIYGSYNGTITNNTRAGIYGVCSTPAATNGGIGVYGFNNINSGNQHIGVFGTYNTTAFGLGVYGVAFGGGIITGNIDAAVVGWRANNNNYSGYFNGNHVIANGTKSASVGTSKGNQLLYVTEAPEVWFEDIGGGTLRNGITHVDLDPLFLETIFVDEKHPMRIFLQEEGESNGLIVIKDSDNKGFTVKEKNSGNSNISFSYRIMAKRLHFQDHRFGNDPVWGKGDTRKYNRYASPPPVDYEQNVRFQEEQRKNYKPDLLPEGFVSYEQLMKQAQEKVKGSDRPKKTKENN